MEELALILNDNLQLKVEDSLVLVFLTAIIIIVSVSIKKLSEKSKMIIIKFLFIGLGASTIYSIGLRVIDAYAKVKGLN